jgi:hypothetical protein
VHASFQISELLSGSSPYDLPCFALIVIQCSICKQYDLKVCAFRKFFQLAAAAPLRRLPDQAAARATTHRWAFSFLVSLD